MENKKLQHLGISCNEIGDDGVSETCNRRATALAK